MLDRLLCKLFGFRYWEVNLYNVGYNVDMWTISFAVKKYSLYDIMLFERDHFIINNAIFKLNTLTVKPTFFKSIRVWGV